MHLHKTISSLMYILLSSLVSSTLATPKPTPKQAWVVSSPIQKRYTVRLPPSSLPTLKPTHQLTTLHQQNLTCNLSNWRNMLFPPSTPAGAFRTFSSVCSAAGCFCAQPPYFPNAPDVVVCDRSRALSTQFYLAFSFICDPAGAARCVCEEGFTGMEVDTGSGGRVNTADLAGRLGSCLSDRSRGFCRSLGEAAHRGGSGECCEGYHCGGHSMQDQVMTMLYFGFEVVGEIGGCVSDP
ncbi:MAG: hypothetical protein M1835_004927 [Candelina submexicana]|nr:MAG: hypothetical protein M1835_004927 [Candelina submexicana]